MNLGGWMEDKALFRVRGCVYKSCRCTGLLVKMSHYHCLTFARAIYNWKCKNDCLKGIKTVGTKESNSWTVLSHISWVSGCFGSFWNSIWYFVPLKRLIITLLKLYTQLQCWVCCVWMLRTCINAICICLSCKSLDIFSFWEHFVQTVWDGFV